ncbi:MAG TPA: phosphatase PAP2 family protein [Vicinamibacterales bacterium]|nr:phosphatase PAP2 family protein [Vicinamibacterales bacterium]
MIAAQAQPPQATDDETQPPQAVNDETQPPGEEKKPPTPPHTGIHALFRNLGDDYKHLWSVDNGIVAAVGGGLALAVHPLDPTFNIHLRSHYALVNSIYAPAKYLGDTPEQVALSIGTYAFGRIFDEPKVSHLGMDLLRAQILSESMVEPLKFAVGRERPDHSNHQSFPSGHASATFAAATIIERHLGWKKAALAYAIAAYVASSRLHDNVHYLSDVVFGSAVGTIAGRTVTQHGANVWTMAPAPVQGGYGIFITRADPH